MMFLSLGNKAYFQRQTVTNSLRLRASENPSKTSLFDLKLVGGFHPNEKYARQIGSFPQVGSNIKNV